MNTNKKPQRQARRWQQISVNAVVILVTVVLLSLSITWSLIM
ncbi:hypothetical protein [uncultured Limnohabitans sp.]|jgi:hypothetical protein|nr:hypothetical protein [uncultured Limnohabitans sp.]